MMQTTDGKGFEIKPGDIEVTEFTQTPYSPIRMVLTYKPANIRLVETGYSRFRIINKLARELEKRLIEAGIIKGENKDGKAE